MNFFFRYIQFIYSIIVIFRIVTNTTCYRILELSIGPNVILVLLLYRCRVYVEFDVSKNIARFNDPIFGKNKVTFVKMSHHIHTCQEYLFSKEQENRTSPEKFSSGCVYFRPSFLRWVCRFKSHTSQYCYGWTH